MRYIMEARERIPSDDENYLKFIILHVVLCHSAWLFQTTPYWSVIVKVDHVVIGTRDI